MQGKIIQKHSQLTLAQYVHQHRLASLGVVTYAKKVNARFKTGPETNKKSTLKFIQVYLGSKA